MGQRLLVENPAGKAGGVRAQHRVGAQGRGILQDQARRELGKGLAIAGIVDLGPRHGREQSDDQGVDDG